MKNYLIKIHLNDIEKLWGVVEYDMKNIWNVKVRTFLKNINAVENICKHLKRKTISNGKFEANIYQIYYSLIICNNRYKVYISINNIH